MADADWSTTHRQRLQTLQHQDQERLTLRHLLLFRQAKLSGDNVPFADQLAAWCETVDDLSTLLWLALTIEGDGQSVVAG